MDETPTFSVTEVCNGIGQMITTAFPDEFWVRGQVSGLSRPRSGHLYLDLVDADGDGGRTVPVLKVNLWAGRRTAIDRQLADAGVELVDGVEVRIRGRLDFYPPQARVSFIMSAIDPAFTLGQLAENRDRILRALHAEGLLRAQERLTVPLVPLDVALVTSQGSAAEADLRRQRDEQARVRTAARRQQAPGDRRGPDDSAAQTKGGGAGRAVVLDHSSACPHATRGRRHRRPRPRTELTVDR